MASAPWAENARAISTASSTSLPPGYQSVAEIRTVIGRREGDTVLVRSLIRDRRDEAGEQVSVCAMQFEEIEPNSFAGLRRADELPADLAHLLVAQLVRNLIRGGIPNRRRCHKLPVPSREWLVHP